MLCRSSLVALSSSRRVNFLVTKVYSSSRIVLVICRGTKRWDTDSRTLVDLADSCSFARESEKLRNDLLFSRTKLVSTYS
jgi:hypothetical protein